MKKSLKNNDCISRNEVLAFLDAKASACMPGSPEQAALQSAMDYILTMQTKK